MLKYVLLTLAQLCHRLLNYDIFLNELPTYFGECHKLNYDISQNMLEIHSEICHNLKVDICLELDLDLTFLKVYAYQM